MVASGDVQSFFGEFLCDVVDGLLHPHQGPSGRELAKRGYELLASQRKGLSGTEIWIKSKGGKIVDIRAIDYSAGGLFREVKHRMKFESFDDARAYFTQNGVQNEQFEAFKDGIQLWKREVVYPKGAIGPFTKQLREFYPDGKRVQPYFIYS